jgi:hypothetical protein
MICLSMIVFIAALSNTQMPWSCRSKIQLNLPQVELGSLILLISTHEVMCVRIWNLKLKTNRAARPLQSRILSEGVAYLALHILWVRGIQVKRGHSPG